MVLNDVLTKQNVINALQFKNELHEIPMELKSKIMKIRLAYKSIKEELDTKIASFYEANVSDELRELSGKEERTDEENARLTELDLEFKEMYQKFLEEEGDREVTISCVDTFTEEEFDDILQVNCSGKAKIAVNGKLTDVDVLTIMESVYVLFVI